jgi:hypothetical protein
MHPPKHVEQKPFQEKRKKYIVHPVGFESNMLPRYTEPQTLNLLQG